MSLNETNSGERVHISLVGRRNVGKSSLINAMTGQNIALVSDVAGTTTDPVKKAMELLPLGPVMITDTPGFDDVGELGELRVAKTHEVLAGTDIALFVREADSDMNDIEREFLSLIKKKKLPYIIVHTKSELLDAIPETVENEIYVSSKTGLGIEGLKEMLGRMAKRSSERRIVSDLLTGGDIVVLVTPIDEAAPKGRIILPQQQTLRDILDSHCTAIFCQDTELEATLVSLAKPPRMVICDSQVFGRVAKITPKAIALTSFSILFARYKGDLSTLVRGAVTLARIKDGDRVLISEGCTHHRQCGDIGTVKLPRLLEKFTGARPEYTFTSGGEFPTDLAEYKIVIHCGGCMLNEAEMKHRMGTAEESGIPIVNYGVALAHMNGILRRSLELFPEVATILDENEI